VTVSVRRFRSTGLVVLAATAALSSASLAHGSPAAQAEPNPPDEPAAFVLLLDGVSLRHLVDPGLRSIPGVTALGSGMLVPQQPAQEMVRSLMGLKARGAPVLVWDARDVPRGDLTVPELIGASISARLLGDMPPTSRSMLVIVLGTSPPAGQAGDSPIPLLVARVSPSEGPATTASPRMGTVTSDSTRRGGIVSGLDLAPTILQFAGEPLPDDLPGSPIRIVHEPPPVELAQRYLAMRRINVPVQYGAMVYVMGAGLLLAWALHLGDRLSPRLREGLACVGLSVAPLGVALLAAGHLPSLSATSVVPFVVGTTLIATAALVPLRRRGVLIPPLALGVAVLAYFAVEAAVGWTAALTPFLGGSQLDGGRFYGLPNAFLGLLIGAALYVAARLSTAVGCALLVGVALFCGLPQLGSDVGGAIATFAAAGLWFAVRSRGRLDLRGLAVAVGVTVVGLAVVAVAHRFFPGTSTHVTRFVEGESGGPLETIAERLRVGLDLIALNPFALIPTIGVFVVAGVAWRPPPAVRPAFARYPVWRDVVLVCALAGVVALFVNDSGPAATGLAFGLALGGLFYVSLSEGPGKMEGHEHAVPAVV
jgi:hypothetical protein